MARSVSLRLDSRLWLFVPPRHRRAEITVSYDGTSSLGHVVEAVGVPRTEVGALLVAGAPVAPSHRPAAGEVVEVVPTPRPQPAPTDPPRFLLDVHLGALARRMRLVGLDTAYRNAGPDAADDALLRRAAAERRVLLTQDRGLLRRRALPDGSYVRGSHPDEQLRDVLDRFAPRLAPWTRCPACNGLLAPVDKSEVLALLPPGTRRTQERFTRCPDCGRVYWRGAHGRRLEALVADAVRSAARR